MISIDFSFKTALITGASQGIGAETAGTFHRAGAKVLINHPGLPNTTADSEVLAADLNAARPGSAIVSFGSIAVIQGFFDQANYAAAKAGVQAMMRVLSRECARRNIRANAVAPGVIDTSMAASIPENLRQEMMKNVPLVPLGSAAKVANVVVFLCSPLAFYVTRQTVEITGGWRE